MNTRGSYGLESGLTRWKPIDREASVDLSKARSFLEENHRAVLVTRRLDGGLQTSPVLVALDSNGRAVISSRETAYKTKNLKRDPHATLCVLGDRFFDGWIQLDGRAEIISLPDAMDGLVDYFRRISGEHSDWADYRAGMEKEHRVLLRIEIDHAGPDVSG
jgi:PPOX class probable F420-dependent enzyme